MRTDAFYRSGKFIYHHRWFVIVLWIAMILVCIPYVPHMMRPFKAVGFIDPNSQSAKTNDLMNKNLGYNSNRFIVMYSSPTMLATQSNFLKEIKFSLSGLTKLPVEHRIIYPDTKNKQISADKHTAYAIVLFKGKQEADSEVLNSFKTSVKQPKNLIMQIGGEPVFLDDTKKQTQKDLYKSEYVATPVTIITMLIVFGSVVAASIPIVLGGIGAFLILMTLFAIGHVFSLSVFTINIALLLGLCLSLDYSLLFVNRYREQLRHGHTTSDAIAMTQSTAGKAVFFSGLAVFISLSALLLFPINILFSVGMGGLAAVLVSMAIALILLPAVLGILNSRIDLWPIKFIKHFRIKDQTYWHWFIKKVVHHPVAFFLGILCLLLLLGYPILNMRLGVSDFRIIPKELPSRQVFDTFKNKFGESRLSPILIMIESPKKNILSSKNVNEIYNFSSTLLKDPRVKEVSGIVTTTPRLTKDQYKLLYSQPRSQLNPDLKKFLDVTTNSNLTVLTVITKGDSNAPESTALINQIRDTKLGNNLKVTVTGSSANTIDVLHTIKNISHYAFLWIIVFTYLILLILLRSVILPLKAIITTILSLCASYGILVLIIQDGYFHNLLNFEPQGMLDISLLIIIFCALFGISMDYEVFLLTRIKEYYEQTQNNVKSITLGIERSSKIITSAAMIVILICFSFMFADIIIVKAFGLGIAVAVFVDAFIIRTVFVPATMTLLNTWNWYLPKWLGKILPNIILDPEHHHRHYQQHH